LKITGFNDKIINLVDILFGSFLNYNEFDKKKFEIYKEILFRSFENLKKDQPYQLVISKSTRLLELVKYDHEDLSELNNQINFEDFQEFLGFWLKYKFIEGYFCGNLLKEDVHSIMDVIDKKFYQNDGYLLDIQKIKKEKILKLEKTNSFIQFKCNLLLNIRS
jgi:secreted Zn-dependent insulinase-like peptidase